MSGPFFIAALHSFTGFELDAQGAEEGFDLGAEGLEVGCGLDVEGDVEPLAAALAGSEMVFPTAPVRVANAATTAGAACIALWAR